MPNLIPSDSSLSLSQIGSELISNSILKPYDTRINRERPACYVFLIDQSGSKSGRWGGNSGKSKAEKNGTPKLCRVPRKLRDTAQEHSEMVVKMYPHFENEHLSDFGKNNLWFL